MLQPVRKPLFFPHWIEAVIIGLLLIMSGMEFMHSHICWSLFFGAAALCFGISLLARMVKGERHDHT